MEIDFQCPHCSTEIKTDNNVSDDRIPCPSCEEIVLIPDSGVKVGSKLAGYQITGHLGYGGMGEVFSATQTSMGRQVALKILPPAVTADKKGVQRFLQEVRMAAKLEHPNVVTALDAGHADGHYYLAMSYIKGEDLESRLRREERISEMEALEIIDRVASALEHAWNNFQMLHRDLKPSNIMVTSEGEVKLLDMGIAKSLKEDGSLTMIGTFVGTPHYISPEQAAASPDIDCRSDIYALGATLYHLVCGRPPFTGPNAIAIITKHLTDTPTSPRDLNIEVSQDTEDLIERMMACEREFRFADWSELREALNRILLKFPGASVTGSYRKPTINTQAFINKQLTTSLSNQKRPPRWVMPSLVSILVLLAGTLGYYSLRKNRSTQPSAVKEIATDKPEPLSTHPPMTSGNKTADATEVNEPQILMGDPNSLIVSIHAKMANKFRIGKLEVGTKIYADQAYRWTEVPEEFIGMIAIRPADLLRKGNNQMTITLREPAFVYLAIHRKIMIPQWLKNWKAMSEGPAYNPRGRGRREFRVWRKAFPKGEVKIGKIAAPDHHVIFLEPQLGRRSQAVILESQAGRQSQPEGLIANVTAASGKEYEIDTLEEGKAVYIDRLITWHTIPEEYVGATFIRTSNEDRKIASPMTFWLNRSADVYIAAAFKHHLLREWEKTGRSISYDIQGKIRTMEVLHKRFAPGRVDINLGDKVGPVCSVFVK